MRANVSYPSLKNDPETNSYTTFLRRKNKLFLDMLGNSRHTGTTRNSVIFRRKQSLGPNNQNTKNTQHVCNAVLTRTVVLVDKPICHLQSRPAVHPTPTGSLMNKPQDVIDRCIAQFRRDSINITAK